MKPYLKFIWFNADPLCFDIQSPEVHSQVWTYSGPLSDDCEMWVPARFLSLKESSLQCINYQDASSVSHISIISFYIFLSCTFWILNHLIYFNMIFIWAFLHKYFAFFSTDIQNCSTTLFFNIFIYYIFLAISPIKGSLSLTYLSHYL